MQGAALVAEQRTSIAPPNAVPVATAPATTLAPTTPPPQPVSQPVTQPGTGRVSAPAGGCQCCAVLPQLAPASRPTKATAGGITPSDGRGEISVDAAPLHLVGRHAAIDAVASPGKAATPTAPAATTAQAAPPQAPATLAGVERVQYVRSLAPNREVQRLALDLDGVKVAVTFHAQRIAVDLVSDPQGELPHGWARDVERTLDQAARATLAPPASGEATNWTARDSDARGNRQPPSRPQPDKVDTEASSERWSSAARQLIESR
jgi:hypothetical protein